AAAETQALFQQLTILLTLATASHFLFRRWHLPMIIGEIAVGIVLGPSVVGNAALGSYRYVFDPAVVGTLAVLGSIFLLFLIGLVVLSVVVGTTAGRVSFVDLVILVTEAVGFLVVGMAIGIYVLRRVVARIHLEGNTLGVPLGGFLVAVAITFLFALTAESLGLSAVVGAFLAGSVFANTTLQDDFSKAARPLAAVFTPIFFVSLGLQVDFPAVATQFGLIPFAIVLTIVAVITKVIGCSLPARLAKMTVREAVAIGWGMTPRGEVGLVVAFAALSAGVVGSALFSMIVVVLILVTILPTPLFRRALKAVEAERHAAAGAPQLAETEPRHG